MWSAIKAAFKGRPQDRSRWTDEQWRDHLLANAMSPSERLEIEAIFTRAGVPRTPR